MSAVELERIRRLLCQLQDHVLESLLAARRRGARGMARIAAVTAADTIYAIDRVSETAVVAWFDRYWPRRWPVELVMEGLDERHATTFPHGTPVGETRYKCILDPIDGTRGLMYDKRSAWSLAGVAPQRGAHTGLDDIFVAAMTELPTSKGGAMDQLSAVRGRGVIATRRDLHTGRSTRFSPRPSRARDVAHGFASFAKFFPEGKTWLARAEEELWRKLKVTEGRDRQPVFDDQYLSTGGQLYELLSGHDRFIADLRPLAFARLRIKSALACHPYDLAAALVAREAGCIVTAPDGRALNAPLDTTTPVAWVGYANATLARRIGPGLRQVLKLQR
ncbi:MAG TPA: inositol monophosphatase [Candidatus Didemnitutus sp.]|nr:inositol monophosphatase [Candidatus Didemnitutus sp.]